MTYDGRWSRARGASPEAVAEFKRLHREGRLLDVLRERHLTGGAYVEPAPEIMPASRLEYHFPTTREKTRGELARVLQVLRDHGAISDAANATTVLRNRLRAHGLTFDGTSLSTRLRALEDEKLVRRVINGRRTTLIELGPDPLPSDLDARYGALPAPTKVRGEVPADPASKRLADLQTHVREAHPAVWANLEWGETHDLQRLEKIDAGLHARSEHRPVTRAAPAAPRPQTDLDTELRAIEAVVDALQRLDGGAACRVLRYALDRFGGAADGDR